MNPLCNRGSRRASHFTCLASVVVCVVLVACVGCKKKPPDTPGNPDQPPAPGPTPAPAPEDASTLMGFMAKGDAEVNFNSFTGIHVIEYEDAAKKVVESEKPLLEIFLKITNKSKTNPLKYDTWLNATPARQPSLKDEHGTEYFTMDVNKLPIRLSVGSTQIPQGETIIVKFACRHPDEKATKFRLVLPGENLQQTGRFICEFKRDEMAKY